MSMDEDVALFLQEFNAPDIFMGVLAKSKCPQLREICVGILGNMACFQEIHVSINSDKNLGQVFRPSYSAGNKHVVTYVPVPDRSGQYLG